ncbi:MAG: hypothetical protein A2057_07750 [Ignavibacteria bacterium GWA2_35_9]|nr:MAG: hypothetical protein A2057_07750 [Ignavibacteria bacterium GWA2_35_9]OGU43183.1 MAG: hypothetical protein A2000_14855 [Ignavibacteria bacterium GWB2_36_8]OGU50394.1 MAG: hypothetical protein A2080_05245 [Ignavibacteria bacterium GWC2_36_12]OGV08783.1 MAG: hypothetical protein A2330_05320 [Ignavibacteria bacterium RIFOXYB2_FULL_36_7]
MNIEKIYNAVDEDDMNSPLSSIVYELEKQGYIVKIEGVEVTANDMDNNLFTDLERATNEFEIELLKDSETEQRFKLSFSDYHKFSFQSL